MKRALSDAAARGVPLRVITTTYMGATERGALDRLIREYGAEVHVSYETRRTRLHAKAWLFKRNTGFDTAYVGSSNLSAPALLDGLEWNVRLSTHATPQLLRKFEATFAQYWNDPSFEPYDPDRDAQRLDEAIAVAGGRRAASGQVISVSGLQVRPFPYQAEMLEALQTEREVHDRHRNLVVAATGTGKTVVAALDYRHLCDTLGSGSSRPSLLFVAHRKEILAQSQRTFREVLGDGSFGELWVDGRRPRDWRHVFASIQSLSTGDLRRMPADAFDVVIIDEFHHAAAPSYERLLKHFHPRELVGLTATPERTDGLDVRSYFGGHISVEMRLWEALEAELLSPFHYFVIADNTDLTQLSWRRGAYDTAELDHLYTGNEARARLILEQVRDLIDNRLGMRAIGFCVGVGHAEWMADVFTRAGIPAKAVAGNISMAEREKALSDLRERRINAIFAVDMFNEGIDLPDIDTVLFLRPTESATVFLQQLGRGLRRTHDKAVLTALDFVGHQRKEFRFDQRFRAITGSSTARLRHDIEEGFPYLPSGCQIVLDRTSQERVLESLRRQIGGRWNEVVAELRRIGDVPLETFLEESEIDLVDVVGKTGRSWTRARREAGFALPVPGPHEAALLKRTRVFVHVDDPLRADAYRRLLADNSWRYADLAEADRRWARMLYFSLWPGQNAWPSYEAGFAALTAEPAVRAEIMALIDRGAARAQHRTRTLDGPLAATGLRSHARYSREELAAALDYATLDRTPNVLRQGVFYAADFTTDALLVTLQKSEQDYSPTTMYRDYAISPELFHWESQAQTRIASPTGQRYLRQRVDGNHILLFTRQTKSWDFGGGAPYMLLGEADYVEHRGEKPLAITWHLRRPMPADEFRLASVAAS
ncbi:UvrABC system protein B [bioreactor metagenome]|uniref:UvrABC system protein B n=2 Tax=root TaxID=1 RepID=A0A644YBT1_9ZZZZ